MSRSIFDIETVMQQLEVISEQDEDRYSDVPGWSGEIMSWSPDAVLIVFDDSRKEMIWLPVSQLRRSEDGQSIYATNWILEKKGLA